MTSSLLTRRNFALALTYSSVAFTALSGIIQLLLAVHPLEILQDSRIILILASLSLLCGALRAYPKGKTSREFRHPSFTVRVQQGSLFAENSHLVIGFTDTFDTDSTDADIISPRSIQAQFLATVYSGDLPALDRDLARALDLRNIENLELRTEKPKGKLTRYPIGTVATLGSHEARHFCVAYSRMGNNLVAQSDVDSLWHSLGQLWEAIAISGHRKRVSMPVIGSELARIDNLDYESILKMLILSFVARSRKSLVAEELTLVLHPRDRERVNMNEVAAFLRSL